MKILIRDFEEPDREICEEILGGLNDWFGIQSSNEGYIAILGKIPTAVAVVDEKIKGFVALEQHNSESVELHIFAVEKKYHGSGIGTELLDWAESWCRSKKVSWFHVKTRGPSTPDPWYEKTRRFYQAKGFAQLFESLTLWGPEDAALIMVKKLSPDKP
jgi:GNAT superfamily N-acetyltransferase